MRFYLALGALVAIGALVFGAFFYGTKVGRDGELAKQASIEQIRHEVEEAAQRGAAREIAKIEVNNVTTTQKLETIVRRDPVFIDCRAGDDVLRLYNEGLAEGGDAPADRELPRANPAP